MRRMAILIPPYSMHSVCSVFLLNLNAVNVQVGKQQVFANNQSAESANYAF